MVKKIIAISCVLMLCILPVSVLAFGPSSNTIYQGIDVSEWQGNIDFKKVKDSGIEVVYIRAGQGFGYEDSKFERNYAEAKKYGLKLGFYHYVTARNEQEAKDQAKFFVSLLANKTIDCKLAMDYEYFPDLNKTQVNKVAIAFLKEVERLTKKETIVYSNAYHAIYTFSGEITKYPLWIAQYGVSKPQSNNWKVWEGYQYTSTGRVNGISGNVDKDQYTKDILLEQKTPIEPVEKPECNREDRIIYKIKRGDTLSAIAQKHNTTVEHLAYINDIKNPNLIYAGETIIISCNHKDYCNKQTYKVKWGDTLSSIAKKYHTTVKDLVKRNQIKNPNLIYAGETLTISC